MAIVLEQEILLMKIITYNSETFMLYYHDLITEYTKGYLNP